MLSNPFLQKYRQKQQNKILIQKKYKTQNLIIIKNQQPSKSSFLNFYLRFLSSFKDTKQKKLRYNIFIYSIHYYPMKKDYSTDKTPKKPVNKKIILADRLFDRPDLRAMSHEKRPRIFSNQSQKPKAQLFPTIARSHQKKHTIDSLPPIEAARKTTYKIKTEASIIDDHYIEEKISQMKKNDAQNGRKDTFYKLKNKHNITKNRLIMQSKMNRTLTESMEVVHLMQKMSGKKQQSPQKESPSKKIVPQQSQNYFIDPVNKTPAENLKQIDAFIILAEEGKVSEYEFYYMAKQESNDYYNMEIVTYQQVQRDKVQDYFTLSAHGITRYEDARPIQFSNLQEWDRQRKCFNQLKSYPFFKKFRKWKSLKKWITILSRRKMKKISEVLQEKLYLLNDNYRNIILSHMAICNDIQQFKFVEIPPDTVDLNTFKSVQQKKRNLLVQRLKQCSKLMHANSSEGFKNVVQDIRNYIISENGYEDVQTQKKQKKGDEKIRIFNQLGFPSNISYGNRSLVRNQFMKFLRLAYLLDFIAIDSLGKFYVSNIQYIKDYLILSYQIAKNNFYNQQIDQDDDITQSRKQRIFQSLAFDPNQKYDIPLPKGLTFGQTQNIEEGKNIFQQTRVPWKPIFSLIIHFEQQIPNSQQMQVIQKYQFDQIKKNFLLFDLPGFIRTGINDEFMYQFDTVSQRKFNTVLSNQIMITSPSKADISKIIIDFFTEALDSIQIVDRWVKNPELHIYAQALEEWDQIIGENWQKSDQKYLNPISWIRENQQYRTFKDHVKQSINCTYSAVQELINQHNQIVNWYWRSNNWQWTCLKDRGLQDQNVVFQFIYNLMLKSNQYVKKYLIQKADFYIYSLDFYEFRKEIESSQKANLKTLCSTYTEIIRQRRLELKSWFAGSIGNLGGLIIRIEEFVEQKMNLDRIILELPKKKQELEVLKLLMKIIEGCEWPNMISKEQKDMIGEIVTLSNNLAVSINDTQSQMPKYIQRFRKQIKTTLQKFTKQVQEVKDFLTQDIFTKNSTAIQQAHKSLKQLEQKVAKLQDYSKKHRQYEQVLEQTNFTNFKHFKETKADFQIKQKIFKGILDLERYSLQWSEINFKEVDVKELTSITDTYLKDYTLAQRLNAGNQALPIFKKSLFKFKDAFPVISALRCPYLQEEDNMKIMKLLNTEIRIHQSQQLTLGQFLEMPFQQCQEQLIDVSICATQYYFLKRDLENFQNQWAKVQLHLKQYKQTSDIIILYDIQELTTNLDQSLATVGNLLANRYIAPLRTKVQKLYNDIILSQQIIEKIVECQKKWVYLQNIFAAQDIKKQLITQAASFATTDKSLKALMKRTITIPLITRLIKQANLLSQMTKNLETLEDIEKKLQDYLQVKRKLFPRFYFISNDQLVEILANSNNISIIQKHINKLYEGIGELYIQNNSGVIEGMTSQEGQFVKFNNPVSTRFNIQIWLQNLQKQMLDTMRKLIRDGYRDIMNGTQKTRVDWILNHKSQVVMTDNQIVWCNDTQQAIKQQLQKRDSVVQWYQHLVKQLQIITQLIRSQLKPLIHKIAVALITADVHNRDIVLNLIGSQVQTIHDFNWQQQLKYFLEDGDLCIIRQVNAIMDYGYQYLGATSRLVITPLTDRCWITITSAVANHLGASPAGPAGTGKTQSTKDLAKGLARVCIVFNCSDQITAQMMSKLFAGLAQQGAWACLDQFNRIDIEVLSVIAQQLFGIRVGLKKQKGEIQLQGKTLQIKKNFGVFITMNPGYAGRTELPDNLKSLFRPVSMMIPDYAMIAQIMLFAQGFEHASELSKKMVQLYKLASQQLSQQKHYDFGLRAVKSLLVMAGELKRADSKCSQEVVLIKAMKQSNIPKFLINDIYLFEALVSDLFPSVEIEETVNQKLRDNTQFMILKHKLGDVAGLSTKIIQLFQVMNIRFGVMIVGQAGVGKTTCYRILKETMNKIITDDPESSKKYYKVEQKVINPKSVTMGQLYGQIDLLSQQWTDGVLSSIIRQCNNCPEKGYYWVTLDGPVDAMWIENLNTVLDDNMTLCLANGERIKLRKQLRMLFQVENLQAASPATVSRCGMVYMPSNENYAHYLENKISCYELEEDYKQHLKANTIPILKKLLELKQSFFQPMPTIKLQVSQLLDLTIKHFLKMNKLTNGYDENIKKLNFIIAYALIWSIGSSIQSQHYSQFQTALRNCVQNVFFPRTETVFDFFLNDTLNGFNSWQTKLFEFEFSKTVEFHDIIVPTVDTLKYTYFMNIMVKQNKPVLFTGESGVGKTSLCVPYLFAEKQNNLQTIFLNFSAKTKPKETQLAIEAKLTKKGKTVFGAKINESIVIFIDDINLPELQAEGAQPTIQLLRQYIDYQGFYDRYKLFWKQIVDTTLMSCGATPRGGRNKLNLRFTRHSAIICLPQPSESNLKKIFNSILKGFFNSYTFSEAVKKSVEGIVNSTLSFYTIIRKQLLPIPAKFHYMFNLRDISKVFQGILQCSPETANTAEKIYQVWYHELERIFGDRLINEQDNQWFQKNASQISKRFGQGIQKQKIKSITSLGIIFTSILSRDTGQILYQFVDQPKKIFDLLQSKMFQYNIESNGKLELVFFKEALQHVLRISRILCLPRGNAMLIGVGGSGKQSLSKISGFIANCEINQLQMGRGYNNESFRGDIQKIARATGVDEKKVCFLFVDTQIIYQEFLESINNMLNTGQVPNLFQKKEQIDEIIKGVRPSAIKNKKVDNPQSLWSFFISNIRSNLHIVLCMSPAGDALRVRSRKFPSLINCCTINWFNSWSQEALFEVAKKALSNVPLSQDEKQLQTKRTYFNELCKLANTFVYGICVQYYQLERRKVQITPKTFLDQLDLFNSVLLQKNRELENNKKILSQGLQKLYSTNDIVANLKVQMTKLQPQLAEQCIKTQEFLKRLAEDKQAANVVERQVQIQTEDANHQTVEIKAIKQDAQAQLSKALPMLFEAEEALKKLNKNDISEIKAYVSPHPIVVMVMQAVCVLLNEKLDWNNIKIVMMQMNFLDRLKNLDKNNIPDNTLKKLRSYTTKPEFEPQIVGQKNMASKSLCLWCKAIDNYAKVAKQVEPKKKKLAALEKQFEDKNKVLFMKQKQLKKVKDKVQKLQKQCQETLQYQNKLQHDLDLTAQRLLRAQKLTVLLKDQGIRWNSLIQSFKALILQIPGQAFLSSIYLSYLGPFTGTYREKAISQIKEAMDQRKIKYPSNFSLTTTLYDQITVRDWILQGLPNDPVSVDNAIIAKKGKRYPLMIDPQSQANRWLKINQQNNNINIINFDQTHYLKTLETAVKCGYSILLEEVGETLESSIDSLLQKKIQIVEGIKMILVGDKKASYDDKFYLYMTTRVSNPKFLAEVFNKSTVINFSITQSGLVDQLLAQVCKLQKPQVQKQRDDIIVQVASNKKFLKQSQDKILRMLAESKGMVLDDIQLIETLQNSKIKSKQVEKDLQKNSIIEEQINRTRNNYVSVAKRGTIIYFVISKLSFIEPMYEFSLNYVKKLYLQGLTKAQSSPILDLRIKKLNDSITMNMFTNISRALFEQHKKLYSFLICTAIKRNAKIITDPEWELFSRGPGLKPKDYKDLVANPDPKFFTEYIWYFLGKVASLIPDLNNLLSEIKSNLEIIKQFFKNENVFKDPFPLKDVKMNRNFLLLLLSRIVKPQNLIFNMSQYVQRDLGKFYDEAQVTSIQQVLSGSNYLTPLLFVLSVGVDPTSNILNYCQSKGGQLWTISLGQGQGKKASNLIQQAKKDGVWVLLNNCHLSKSWLGSLQKIIEEFSEETITNQNFRLLLSSLPVSYFPSNILQNSDKITLEPPRGLKPNIARSFKQMHEDILNLCPNRRKQWLRSLYSLTFFHALLQQRRKYGPLGFNIRYDFNDSDLEMSISTLKLFLNDNRQEINWDAIWYMVGQINYGGRVTDDWDRICLMSTLKKCLNPDMLSVASKDKYFYSDSEDYYCLNSLTLEDFQISIERFLPQNDTPEVFGLHQNANLSFILQQSQRILHCIQAFEPKATAGSSIQETTLETIKNLSSLPQPIPKHKEIPQHLLKGAAQTQSKVLPSMTNFLLQQVDKFNNLLSIIKKTLDMLEKAINGFIPMNQQLDQMTQAFSVNQIPKVWRKYGYQTLKPLSSWFIDFKQRIQFLTQWVNIATPAAYWISCFFFPQGLLTALLQTHSRKYKIAIDTLSFKFKVTQIEKEKLISPKDGGYIYGLFFDGARWDYGKDTITDEVPGVLNQSMPCILLTPTENYEIAENQYNCPCYKTGKRSGVLSTTGQSTNFILGIHLNSKVEKPEYWTLKGAALLCQLNY